MAQVPILDFQTSEALMEINNAYIDGCKKGESACQRAVYDLLLPVLNGMCTRYLHHLSDREDILQETFLKIFSRIGQFDAEKGSFFAWSARILINACLQHNKKLQTRRNHEKVNEQQWSVHPSIMEKLSNDDLLSLLQQMPGDYYEVFNLYIIDGFSHQEIAEILQIEESLSRKRLSRARGWLEKKMENNPELNLHLKYTIN